MCIIDQIEYGNFMILLAEADCSHMNIHTYVQQKLLREYQSECYSYDMYYTPEIRFHLITLNGNGEMVCQIRLCNGLAGICIYTEIFDISTVIL